MVLKKETLPRWRNRVILVGLFCLMTSISLALPAQALGAGSCYLHGDVNGDARVDAGDAILVLKKLVGLIDSFPVEAMESGEEFKENILLMDFGISQGDLYITYPSYDEWGTFYLDSIAVTPDCAITGADNIYSACKNLVDLTINIDNEVTSIAVKGDYRIGPVLGDGAILTEITVNGDRIEVQGQSYFFASPTIVTSGNPFLIGCQYCNYWDIPAGVYNQADAYQLVLNQDHKIVGVFCQTLPPPSMVKEVLPNRIIYMDMKSYDPYGQTQLQSIITSDHIFVVRNNLVVELSDLQPGDLINVAFPGYQGFDHFIIASSASREGTLDAYRAVLGPSGEMVQELQIGGKWYSCVAKTLVAPEKSFMPVYSTDNGQSLEGYLTGEALQDLDGWGQPARILLTNTGKVAALIMDLSSPDSQSLTGVITDISPLICGDQGTSRAISLLAEDNQTHAMLIDRETYIKVEQPPGTLSCDIEDLSNHGIPLGLDSIEQLIQPFSTAGQYGIYVSGLVSVSFDLNNKVDKIVAHPGYSGSIGPADIDTNNGLLGLESRWFNAQNVKVFNLNNGLNGPAQGTGDLDETQVVGWDALTAAEGIVEIKGYIAEDLHLKAIIVNSAPLSAEAPLSPGSIVCNDLDNDDVYSDGDTITLYFSQPIQDLPSDNMNTFVLFGGNWGNSTVVKDNDTSYTITLYGASVVLGNVIQIEATPISGPSVTVVFSLPELHAYKYGVVEDIYQNQDTWVKLLGQEPVRCELLMGDPIPGDVVVYREYQGFIKMEWSYGYTIMQTVSAISGNLMEMMEGETYKLDKETSFFDIRNQNDMKILSRDQIYTGDVVVIFIDGDPSLARVVVIP